MGIRAATSSMRPSRLITQRAVPGKAAPAGLVVEMFLPVYMLVIDPQVRRAIGGDELASGRTGVDPV
jgi:hypothetical protein